MKSSKLKLTKLSGLAAFVATAALLSTRCGLDPTQGSTLANAAGASLAAITSSRPTVAQLAKVDPAIAASRQPIPESQVLNAVVADLRTLSRNDQFFARYFTLANQWNAGASDDLMAAFRNGLAKYLNHLSFNPQITLPRAIDPTQTVYRVDLRALGWERQLWDQITAEDPYQVFSGTAQEQEILARTGARIGAIVRADWCAAVCLQPKLYNLIMQIPGNLFQLEADFGVDSDRDIQTGNVVRAGFNQSGVSSQNRVIEYHRTQVGDYWKSFDFQPEQRRVHRNIFEFALDPRNFGNNAGFDFAAGEFIFQLPNGLSLYMLADNNGKRLDEAVTAIVQDPTQSDAAVTDAVSCFRCHVNGMIQNPADEIRPHIQKNAFAFNQQELSIVAALYPGQDTVNKLFTQYNTRFAAAMAPINQAFPCFACNVPDQESVTLLAAQFEADMPITLAAADLNLDVNTFETLLQRSAFLTRRIGNVTLNNGNIKRAVFEDNFAFIVDQFGLGEAFRQQGVIGGQ